MRHFSYVCAPDPNTYALCADRRINVIFVARKPWAFGTRTLAACVARLPVAARPSDRVAPSTRPR